MRGVREDRCGHRDDLRTKQLDRSGLLSNHLREALCFQPKTLFIKPIRSFKWYNALGKELPLFRENTKGWRRKGKPSELIAVHATLSR